MAKSKEKEVNAPNIYWDRLHNIEAAKIMPGEYYVTSRDMLIVTVLGSCVSACVRDTVMGIGGMNHFMLPGKGGEDDLLSSSARYGNFAMEILINELIKLGAKRSNLEAKIFGGGNVLAGFTSTNVGEKNANFILHYLETEQIRIAAEDLLGLYPRKVYFYPRTGKVMVRQLRSMHNDTILERERVYVDRIEHSKVSGQVEIFNGKVREKA